MDRRRYHGGAGRTALVGVLSALSLAVLTISAFSPSGRLGLTAAAGLFPAGAVISAGLGAGFFCYATVGVLGLLLLPDKGCALLYLLFFGLWPMLKSLLEQLPNQGLVWVCKLAVCNGILALLWFGLREILLPFLPPVFDRTWMIFLGGSIAFLIYDVGFSKLIGLYMARVDRVLRKGR